MCDVIGIIISFLQWTWNQVQAVPAFGNQVLSWGGAQIHDLIVWGNQSAPLWLVFFAFFYAFFYGYLIWRPSKKSRQLLKEAKAKQAAESQGR